METWFEYYKERVLGGDFMAVDEAAQDNRLTNGEYCELYSLAIEKAKEIGC